MYVDYLSIQVLDFIDWSFIKIRNILLLVFYKCDNQVH